MILKNNSKALISIPTTPFRSKKEAIETVKSGESLSYSKVDILPTEQQEVPDEFCNTDFVLNLLDIGELTRVMGSETVEAEEDEDEPESLPRKTRSVKAPKPAKPTKSTKAKADTKAELNAARDRADIAGINFKDNWTVAQIDAAIKNHKK